MERVVGTRNLMTDPAWPAQAEGSWDGLVDAVDYLAALGWRVALERPASSPVLRLEALGVLDPAVVGGGRRGAAVAEALAGYRRSVGWTEDGGRLDAVALAYVGAYRLALTWVALGRYSGHAPSVCTVCGFTTMLSVVDGSTRRGLSSTPWPRCLLSPQCAGRRVIREPETLGVRRVKQATTSRAGTAMKHKRRPPMIGE